MRGSAHRRPHGARTSAPPSLDRFVFPDPVEVGLSDAPRVRSYAIASPMFDPMAFFAIPAALIAVVYFLRSIRQVNQWETALRFTLGKLSGRVDPGLTLVFPGFQNLVRVDTRI